MEDAAVEAEIPFAQRWGKTAAASDTRARDAGAACIVFHCWAEIMNRQPRRRWLRLS